MAHFGDPLMAADMRNHLEKQAENGHEWVVYDTDNPINTQYDLHCFADEMEAISFAKEYQQIWNWHEAVPIGSLIHDLKELERSQLQPKLGTELNNPKSTLKINKVSMEHQVNRAEELWKNWANQERQIEELGGETDKIKTLKYKYDFLSKGLYRVSVNPTEKEKLLMQAISTVTAKLQKQLYPHPVIRLLHRLKALIIDKPEHLSVFTKGKEGNLKLLKEQFETAGLHHYVGKLENSLDYERPRIELRSVNALKDNGKLELNIDLEKNKFGNYHFNGYTATLITQNGERKTCTFSADSSINLTEAVNLLRGRSVFKAYEHSDGTTLKKWVQLDHRDKDLNGNPEILTFSPKYEYDLKKLLLDSAIKLDFYSISREAVQRGLEAGNKVEFQINGNGRYTVAANPSAKTVDFFDANKKPISLAALKKIIHPVKKETAKDLRFIKQKDITQENQIQINR